GTATSGVYNGVARLIQSGRGNGTWNGNGIVSSDAAASNGVYAIGIGEASDLLGLSGNDTAVWMEQTVGATAVLVRYTYAGDDNLDDVIDFQDYARMGAGVSSSATGWSNGDFNYDGVINATDLGIINSNVGSNAVVVSDVSHDSSSVTLTFADDEEPQDGYDLYYSQFRIYDWTDSHYYNATGYSVNR